MDHKRKRELRDLNARAWSGEKDAFPVESSLDSSMKKNTAFIKRLRTAITASSEIVFLQEIRTLSLHKYLSEIISACYEGLCKARKDDTATAVEVFCALHQRFGPEEFTGYVGWLIGRGLSTPDKAQLKQLAQDVREKEERERLVRHRNLLRVVTELWLVGAIRSLEDVIRPEEVTKAKENTRSTSGIQPKASTNGLKQSALDEEPFPLEVLKDLLGQDPQHINLPLVVMFIKSFAWDILGKKIENGETIAEDMAPLVEPGMQQRFRNILVRYFEDASIHLEKDQAALNNQSKRNAEAYVRSGEIFEDRQANFEKQTKAHEKFVANMEICAEALELPMPDLKERDSTFATSDGNIGLVKTGEYLRGESEDAGIWEDEDERRFYENLIDLKDRVPGILLEDAKKKKPDQDEQVGRKAEEKVAPKPDPSEKAEQAIPTEGDSIDQSTAIANKTVGAQVDALLARLPEITTKELVDQAAMDFCFLNSKASRNRLVKAIQEVPKGRSDLLPMYARLVTTLGRYMTDISQGLVSHLDEEFRSLQRRKQKDSLGGVRTSNIRYLAELTKFGLVPEHVIFHCLKVSLDEFSKMNIEIICNLLENCGRYLLRNPETSPRMKSFLETLQRKKGASHLGQQERMLIENAMYYVHPPERAAILQKERTPTDMFLRKLIYVDLNKRNLERIAKQIRKLHWEEDEVVATLHKIFVKPAKIKYSNIHFLAIILGTLNRYHPMFSMSVIDDLLESITFGLELNDFKFNQRRIAEVRYLGELYVYRMIDSSIVFDTLFRILTFGHGGWPRPGNICPLDLPDDFFRIRLVCILLETCGSYYEKGSSKKKFDFFLTFFQYYISTKEVLPMEIEFVVQDAFAYVRPQWKLITSLPEAGAAFAEACKDNYKTNASEKAMEPEDNEDLDEDADLDGRRSPSIDEDDRSSGDEADDAGVDQPKTPEPVSSDEEEHIIVTRPEDEHDPEADAEFDRELAKMMAESVETRKVDRRPMFDVALPMKRLQRDTPGSTEDNAFEPTISPPNTIKFSLLSKRGNRPQTRHIDLPADSNFAVAMRNQQEAEKAEQQRIKKLVLNYDLREDVDPDGDIYSSLYIPPNPNYIARPECNITDTTSTEHSGLPSLDRSGQTQVSSANPTGSSTNVSGNTIGQGVRGSKRLQPRKLQLSDVEWYDPSSSFPSHFSPAAEDSNSQYVDDKRRSSNKNASLRRNQGRLFMNN